jgi:hypothetical protein
MPTLPEVQAAFRRALLGGAEGDLAALVVEDGLAAGERLAVYRNTLEWTLTDALRDSFPVVCRLVDARFFAYAAHSFLRCHPPECPSLAEYGARFPDFLAAFPPCRHLFYLPDVARFEWLMNAAAHATDAAALPAAVLAGMTAAEASRLIFRLHPALGYLASSWPVDRIWRVNQPHAAGDDAVDLGAGGVHLEVGREGRDVVFRVLDHATFVFRDAIARGAVLEAAIEAALAIDARFDLGVALAGLFAQGAVVAVSLGPETAS